LCSLQYLASLNDVMYVDEDSSRHKLVRDPIVTRLIPTSSSRRRCRAPLGQLGPSPPSDENAASRFARRSLFSRRVTTSPPLRDVGNTTPKSSFRRCASDTAASDCGRRRPTALTKSHSMSTAVLTAVTDNDDQRLVGDFTRQLCLPVVNDTKHCDLNTISHHTVQPLRKPHTLTL